MDYYCEHCGEEVSLETDGYKILDSDCPECGRPIDYEEASRDWISGLADAYDSMER
jgi:DNA-directed RNA polymerase subunit RPC12/RpoP